MHEKIYHACDMQSFQVLKNWLPIIDEKYVINFTILIVNLFVLQHILVLN